jgi:hypothetical protein
MNRLPGFGAVVLVCGLAGCGGSTASAPSPVPAAPAPAPFELTGHVYDTAIRAVAGVRIEVLDGPQAGTSATTDAAGAFSLAGTFGPTTRFRAARDGYVTATSTLTAAGLPNGTLGFFLEVQGGSVDMAGNYTLTFIADSACAADLPADTRTRSYAATLSANQSPGRAVNTQFVATLTGGGELDRYYRNVFILVAGDFVDFDLSDNYVEEEVGEGRYLAIGGVGGASIGQSNFATMSAPFKGGFDYCVPKTEPAGGERYSCAPEASLEHAQCYSNHHRVVLTRR